MKENSTFGSGRSLNRHGSLAQNRSLQFGIVGMILPLLIATRLMTARSGDYIMEQVKSDAPLSKLVQSREEEGKNHTVPTYTISAIEREFGIAQSRIVHWLANKKGEVAFSVEEDDRLRSYMIVNGKRTEIRIPGARDVRVRKINERGDVIGMIARPDRQWNRSVWRAFVWRKGRLIELDTLGGPNGFANDINEEGVVVGKADTAQCYPHAFLWREGQPVQDLGTLPRGQNSEAMSINGRGEIVGCGDVDGETRHALLWRQGVLLDLNKLVGGRNGWDMEEGREINERGDILVYGAREHLVDLFLLRASNPASSCETQ
jgi:probable HAF family extracellular repeat protein